VTDILERRAAITGIGQSDVGRRLHRSPLDLTLDACLAAIEDAGLTRSDIDGVATYPGSMDNPPGFSGAGVSDVQDALRLDLNWYTGGLELPAQLGSVVDACMAVACGLATHVLCFRTVWEGTAQGDKGRASVMSGMGGGSYRATGFMQWTLPFGAPSAANWIACYAQRHFHEYGTTREQLAQVALNARRNAAHNPKAVYREPMTMEDYLGVRMISSPLCLYDCDVPADGSTAVVVSAADQAADRPNRPVYIEAIGTAMRTRFSWDQQEDLAAMAATGAAEHLWSRTGLTPGDVDVAELYDGFSILALAWIEALGFCKPGEGGAFLEGGRRIALDGELPLNTSGGQLSAGRLHGFGLIHEAVTQLRGAADDRQVAEARVAAVGNGGGPIAGAMLLTAERV